MSFTDKDREMLIRVDERSVHIDKKLEDHLTAHRWAKRGVFGAVCSFIVGLILWIIKG